MEINIDDLEDFNLIIALDYANYLPVWFVSLRVIDAITGQGR